jgi:hypothetical protein
MPTAQISGPTYVAFGPDGTRRVASSNDKTASVHVLQILSFNLLWGPIRRFLFEVTTVIAIETNVLSRIAA